MQPAHPRNFSFGVVILAAGASRRMGTQKLLLPWGESSVLGHLMRQWSAAGAVQISVVCARGAQAVQDEFTHCSSQIPCPSALVFNPAPERGMFSSIRCAANWTGWTNDVTHWVITLGDQPQLRADTLRALVEFAAAHPETICQPIRAGRRKHPVVLPKTIFLQLRDSTATDLKQFLAGHEHCLGGFESEDAGLDHDLDTPADYQRLHKLCS